MDEPWHYINAVKEAYKVDKSDVSAQLVSQKLGIAAMPKVYLPL